MRGGVSADDTPLGTEGIQSLADLASSFEAVRRMSMASVALKDVILVALAGLVPLAPVMLTVMPLEQLLKLAFGLLR